jgi:hypothetical protein
MRSQLVFASLFIFFLQGNSQFFGVQEQVELIRIDSQNGLKTVVGPQYSNIVTEAHWDLTIDQQQKKIYFLGFNQSDGNRYTFQMATENGIIENSFLMPFRVCGFNLTQMDS